MQKNNQRPIYLNLLKIKLPITGIVSILHRISGVLLFLLIPFVVYGFGLSVSSQVDFDNIKAAILSDYRLLLPLVIWAIAHHLFAGIRFLLTDLDIGLDLKAARMSAWLVNIAGGLVFIVALIKII